MFERQNVSYAMPGIAGREQNYICTVCGESAVADWTRFVDGKPYCLDCFAELED